MESQVSKIKIFCNLICKILGIPHPQFLVCPIMYVLFDMFTSLYIL